MFRVWLFVYVSLYVCKCSHDTGEIPSVGQLKKNIHVLSIIAISIFLCCTIHWDLMVIEGSLLNVYHKQLFPHTINKCCFLAITFAQCYFDLWAVCVVKLKTTQLLYIIFVCLALSVSSIDYRSHRHPVRVRCSWPNDGPPAAVLKVSLHLHFGEFKKCHWSAINGATYWGQVL